jgi:predicted TIM-barrel fold metal-dependent hydrolase
VSDFGQFRSVIRREATILPDPPKENLWCPIISVDDHVIEPLSIFRDRVPARLRAEVPYVVYEEENVPYWIIDDARVSITVTNGASGRPPSEWTQAPQRIDEFRLGVSDPAERLADMDLCGVWSSLNFPSVVWGFTGWRLSKMSNQAAGLAAVEAYNDWMLEEWCGSNRDRFIPCQIPWLADPELAASQIRRNAERGFVSVSFSENPECLGFPSLYSTHWDPFFRACEETDTVINLHIGSSGTVQRPSLESPDNCILALFPLNGVMSVADWIFARIPLRFPGLKIVPSEAGVSWVPMLAERLRRSGRQLEASLTPWSRDDPSPEELLRNFWFASLEDPSAFKLLDVVGEDRIMVETDFPHPDSTWPLCQAMVRSEMAHLAPATVRKICFETAAQLYRQTKPPQEWIDRSDHVSADQNRAATS